MFGQPWSATKNDSKIKQIKKIINLLHFVIFQKKKKILIWAKLSSIFIYAQIELLTSLVGVTQNKPYQKHFSRIPFQVLLPLYNRSLRTLIIVRDWR